MQVLKRCMAAGTREVLLGGKAERPSNSLLPRLLALFGSLVDAARRVFRC